MARLLRFGLVGGLTTVLAYVIFVGLMRLRTGYIIASIVSWAAPMTISYLLNRRFTFQISGIAGPPVEMATFLTGSFLQLLLGVAGYAMLIGVLALGPTPAFAINLTVSATFGFLFMRWVTFRAGLASRDDTLPDSPPS